MLQKQRVISQINTPLRCRLPAARYQGNAASPQPLNRLIIQGGVYLQDILISSISTAKPLVVQLHSCEQVNRVSRNGKHFSYFWFNAGRTYLHIETIGEESCRREHWEKWRGGIVFRRWISNSSPWVCRFGTLSIRTTIKYSVWHFTHAERLLFTFILVAERIKPLVEAKLMGCSPVCMVPPS